MKKLLSVLAILAVSAISFADDAMAKKDMNDAAAPVAAEEASAMPAKEAAKN